MSHPTTLDEYNTRFLAGYQVTGSGWDGVYVHLPCVFCAAPEFAVYNLMAMEEVLTHPHECAECGRAAKLVFSASPHSTSFRIVQTSGPDAPGYFPHLSRADPS